MYENLRKSGRRKPAVRLAAMDLRTTEGQYENLRIGHGQNNDRHIYEENNGKNIQWKDLAKQIRYTIYVLSLVLFLLCSIVVTAVVVIYLLKGEDKCDSDGAWSNCCNWEPCSESCGGGIKNRLRKNPGLAKLAKGCEVYSLDKRVTDGRKGGQSDDRVSFLAYGSSSKNSVITFPTIFSNRGNGYNSNTGRFTCKRPGIYNFVVTLTKPKRGGRGINACIRINGVEKLRLNSFHSVFDVVSFSMDGNVHLNTSDYVDVYSSTKVFQNDCSTSFTGTLVNPDD